METFSSSSDSVSIVGVLIVFAYMVSDRTVLKKKNVSTIYTRRCDFCPSQVKFNLIFFSTKIYA